MPSEAMNVDDPALWVQLYQVRCPLTAPLSRATGRLILYQAALHRIYGCSCCRLHLISSAGGAARFIAMMAQSSFSNPGTVPGTTCTLSLPPEPYTLRS